MLLIYPFLKVILVVSDFEFKIRKLERMEQSLNYEKTSHNKLNTCN